MIQLVQFPWSPFCIVQRRILEYSGAKFRTADIPNGDRSLVWKMTRGRYYQVPIIRDGKDVVFETGEDSQVIAKYLDEKLRLRLFPRELDGVQSILWRYIESEVEGHGFKLNDIYAREFVPQSDWLRFLRHKERKFGRGCLDHWREQQPQLLEGLTRGLLPFEQMLLAHQYLLGDRPHFVDFDLYGMLGNFLYSGRYELPTAHPRVQDWFERMNKIKFVRSP